MGWFSKKVNKYANQSGYYFSDEALAETPLGKRKLENGVRIQKKIKILKNPIEKAHLQLIRSLKKKSGSNILAMKKSILKIITHHEPLWVKNKLPYNITGIPVKRIDEGAVGLGRISDYNIGFNSDLGRKWLLKQQRPDYDIARNKIVINSKEYEVDQLGFFVEKSTGNIINPLNFGIITDLSKSIEDNVFSKFFEATNTKTTWYQYSSSSNGIITYRNFLKEFKWWKRPRFPPLEEKSIISEYYGGVNIGNKSITILKDYKVQINITYSYTYTTSFTSVSERWGEVTTYYFIPDETRFEYITDIPRSLYNLLVLCGDYNNSIFFKTSNNNIFRRDLKDTYFKREVLQEKLSAVYPISGTGRKIIERVPRQSSEKTNWRWYKLALEGVGYKTPGKKRNTKNKKESGLFESDQKMFKKGKITASFIGRYINIAPFLMYEVRQNRAWQIYLKHLFQHLEKYTKIPETFNNGAVFEQKSYAGMYYKARIYTRGINSIVIDRDPPLKDKNKNFYRFKIPTILFNTYLRFRGVKRLIRNHKTKDRCFIGAEPNLSIDNMFLYLNIPTPTAKRDGEYFDEYIQYGLDLCYWFNSAISYDRKNLNKEAEYYTSYEDRIFPTIAEWNMNIKGRYATAFQDKNIDFYPATNFTCFKKSAKEAQKENKLARYENQSLREACIPMPLSMWLKMPYIAKKKCAASSTILDRRFTWQEKESTFLGTLVQIVGMALTFVVSVVSQQWWIIASYMASMIIMNEYGDKKWGRYFGGGLAILSAAFSMGTNLVSSATNLFTTIASIAGSVVVIAGTVSSIRYADKLEKEKEGLDTLLNEKNELKKMYEDEDLASVNLNFFDVSTDTSKALDEYYDDIHNSALYQSVDNNTMIPKYDYMYDNYERFTD